VKCLWKVFGSWNRIPVIEAVMCFMMCRKVIRVVKTLLQDDCSGAGSHSDFIRGVMLVMGISNDRSDCPHEYKIVKKAYD